MKSTLKRLTPRPLWSFASSTYWDWRNRGRHVFAQKIDARWVENLRRVEAYRNIHAGKRCFIIGNGPSLRQMDLHPLKDEITFGMNRIYLAFPEWGFGTSYLVSVNDLVLEQCAQDMKALALPKFITWRARRWLSGDRQTLFLDTDFTGEENFSGEATGRLFEGFTVTNVALQLAFFMGCQEAILIGVDHSYITQGAANQMVVSQGDDPNHFNAGYFGKGFKWQNPDLEGSERGFRRALAAYQQAGRRVLDATVGGKLDIFPKVSFTTLFDS
ncbi:MAG: 6-hydroxymethylpterin diphosphokinase MptE-like protein [Chloroflexota bacterium]